jgi:hypothetical protein
MTYFILLGLENNRPILKERCKFLSAIFELYLNVSTDIGK